MLQRLADLVFGRPVLGRTEPITREEFERRREMQDWRKRRIETEAGLWVRG